MPLPTLGPNRRALSATETPEHLSDAEVTLAQPSTPPPLPLIRRKATAEVAYGLPVPTGSAGHTAPWPVPPLSHADSDSARAEAPEAEPDFAPATARWWRKVKAPSRPVWVGALVAVLAAGIGWTAGAKPWSSQRTTRAVAVAKQSPNQAKATAVTNHARASQTPAHVTRRVATNTKTKAIIPATTSVKVPAKTAAKTPVKTAAKTPVKATQKAPAKTAAKTPVKATQKASAKTTVAATKTAKAVTSK